MTTLTLERAAGRGSPFAGPTGGGPTLADVIASVWEGLPTGAPAQCPVCSGELVLIPPASGGDLPRARCRDCGSELR